ncbi:MAG: DUF3995 domain-containing protein [Chitinophagales bacterium]
MQTIIPLILTDIFLTLSILHFYWAFGGKWGFDKALPTNEDGERLLQPKPIHSAIVGLGLMGFAGIYLLQANLFSLDIPILAHISGYALWAIPIIFLLRTVGDFKYVGFSKKIKQTNFARLDTQFYAPLCLFISILAFFVLHISA